MAAFAVVVGHLFAAAYRETGDEYVRSVSAAIAIDFVDWGRFGVTLFFLISGYVVPEFLVRGGAKQVFAAQRITRIYPTFWLSVLVVIVSTAALQSRLFDWSVIIANLTLFPNVFRIEWLSGVYWTLNIEMIFYALCVAGAATGILNSYRSIFSVMLVLVALSIAPIVINHVVERRVLPVQYTSYYVSFLLSGVLLKIWTRNQSNSVLNLFGACVPFLAVPIAAGIFFDVPGTFVAHSGIASVVGHALALIVFLVMVVFRRGAFGSMWLKIGESSYSLYLFHWPICAVVIHFVGFGSMGSTLGIVFASTILSLLAARFTYWFIERPSIQFGVRLRNRLS